MTDVQLLRAMQKHVAQISANSSSIRKQGAPGMVAAAQGFLSQCDLRSFVRGTQKEFSTQLNVETECLRQSFPVAGQHWGTARKILNIFLRDSAYNRFLAKKFALSTIEAWLEVPLDSHVASNLAVEADARKLELPPWTTIKKLTSKHSSEFQQLAQIVADDLKTLRAHLDLLWWRNPAKVIKPQCHATA